MRKKSLLTKVVALGAMTTLLASSTAFAAATYSTRTLYKAGSNEGKVEVATIVTGLTANDEVTYLAGSAEKPVYINQYTANPVNEDGKYVFKYTTDAANIGTTSIKMAKTASDFTGGVAVAAANGESATLPATGKFSFEVYVDDVNKGLVYVDPNTVAAGGIVNLSDIKIADDREIVSAAIDKSGAISVKVTKAEAGINVELPTGNDALVVIDDELNVSPNQLALKITTKQTVVKNPEISYVGGYKAATYENATVAKEDGTTENITGPMFAMYGHAKDCDEFGVAVSFVGEWDGNTTAGKEVLRYQALANDNGDFAVAIIDDANAENCMKEAWARVYMTYTHDENIKRVVYGDLIHISFK